jgi:hypothetical protein
MLRGIPPTKVGKNREQFARQCLLLVFVDDFDQMYDSVVQEADGVTDLSKTLFYKVMTMCGTFISVNRPGKK